MEGHAALDDQSAFVAGLGAARSPRMRDVLGTVRADQDAIIRASSRGALVVDGGPGTGKTVVALHRAAYLLYSDPRLGDHRGGVLFVGPHQPYLAYVADVLPSLGEEGVQTCTLRHLVPEGGAATAETDPRVAALKSSTELVNAIDPAVRLYEEAPTQPTVVDTPWADVVLTADDWARAFEAPDPATPHHEARDEIWDELVAIVAGRHDVDAELVRTSLRGRRGLATAVARAWPTLEYTDLVADLWSVPAYLHRCAPSLGPAQVRMLQRPDPYAWTVADLPLLDAARHRLGDPQGSRLHRRRQAAVTAERARMSRVVDDLIASDDSDLRVMSMLRAPDLQAALVDDTALPSTGPDLLAGPFAHIVVDEAQELTDAEWHMLLRRCPSRSLTVVGDRAEARHGFAQSWGERLGRVGIDRMRPAGLRINYRTPQEVMAVAEPTIRSVLPDANVPISISSNGIPVTYGSVSDLDRILDGWLAEHSDGIACVVTTGQTDVGTLRDPARVRVATPELTKGLEFDLVVLVEPSGPGGCVERVVDRYVAMTRATERLVVLTGP